jgi:HK97 gp10 family phage protein
MLTPELVIELKFDPTRFSERALAARREKLRQIINRTASALEQQSKESMPRDPPSIPGNPPVVRTGNLMGSIQTSIAPPGGGLLATVSVGAHYGLYLERGTKTEIKTKKGSRMRIMLPRPFMRPAVEYVRAGFENAIANELGLPR